MMRTAFTFTLLLLAMLSRVTSAAAPPSGAPELISVEMIWDKTPHNAFTDLIRYNDQWVCAFREAPEHKGGVKDSMMRVVVSPDTKSWAPAASLSDPRGDIRDAKMAILPDGRLTLLTAIQLFDRSKGQSHQSIAYFTRDLKTWEGPTDVGQPNFWMWGIKFHKGTGYSIGYATGSNPKSVRLYKTTDGVKYEPIVEKLEIPAPFPNENAIHFDADDTAHVLQRCDPVKGVEGTTNAFLGTAKPPYIDWKWIETTARVGGPALTRTPDGRLLGAGRLYEPKPRTSLFWIDEKTGAITECLTFPSGGDTSYPGLVWHEGVLHVSYYSSHEDKKSRIYFAKVKVPPATASASASR
jgi:hypothetical protein